MDIFATTEKNQRRNKIVRTNVLSKVHAGPSAPARGQDSGNHDPVSKTEKKRHARAHMPQAPEATSHQAGHPHSHKTLARPWVSA